MNATKKDLFKGSLILLIMLNSFNLLNYVYQFFMARMLSMADYGVFAALMSLIYLLGVPMESTQIISSKYSSVFNGKNEWKTRALVDKMFMRGLKFSLIVYLIFIPLALFLAWFMGINVWLVLLTGTLVFCYFITPISRGVLQGKKKFLKMGMSFLSESIFKIIFGISFIFFGFKVYGAMGGVIVGALFSLILSFYFIKDVYRSKKRKIKIDGGRQYSISVFFILLIIFFMFSVDIIFAKRFFSEDVAGAYAVASLMGKMIFFAITPISKAMFPLTSGLSKKNSSKIFFNTIKITLLVGIIGVIFLAVFPKLLISILFGSKYLAVFGILWVLGIAFLFLSLANVAAYYLLSLKKRKNMGIFLIFPIIQIALLYMFNKNLFEFSSALAISFALLLGGLLLAIKNEKD